MNFWAQGKHGFPMRRGLGGKLAVGVQRGVLSLNLRDLQV